MEACFRQSAPSRFVVAVTCGPRAAAGSARVADASLSQLPQKGSRRLFARFCASCRRHYQRAAAVSCRGGGRRRSHRLRWVAFLRLWCEHIGLLSWYRRFLPRHPAPPLRGEIQSATCVDSPHRARSPHVVPCIHLCSLLAAAAERRVEARLARCGLPPRVAMSWACAISPTTVCFTHTEPTPKQKAGSSWTAGAVGACCVSARGALRVSAPVAMAAANGARPAASGRLCCSWLDRGRRRASISQSGSLCSPMRRSCWHGYANAIRPAASAHFSCRLHRADNTLHVADGVDGRAHEARLPPWRCQRRQPPPVGSLLVRGRKCKAPARCDLCGCRLP
jgi:hypothetical protein